MKKLNENENVEMKWKCCYYSEIRNTYKLVFSYFYDYKNNFKHEHCLKNTKEKEH